MSYDIDYHSTIVDAESLSPTYNIGGMFRAALHMLPEMPDQRGSPRRGIYALHGLTGAEALPALQEALRWMDDPENAEAIAEMEPSNGWGSSSNARSVLRKLRRWAAEDPDGVFDSEYGWGLKWTLTRADHLIPEAEAANGQ